MSTGNIKFVHADDVVHIARARIELSRPDPPGVVADFWKEIGHAVLKELDGLGDRRKLVRYVHLRAHPAGARRRLVALSGFGAVNRSE